MSMMPEDRPQRWSKIIRRYGVSDSVGAQEPTPIKSEDGKARIKDILLPDALEKTPAVKRARHARPR